jgi:two-component system response regulator AtoC
MQQISETPTRVLIADPIKDNRVSLIDTLSSSGIACLEVADGVAAWTRFTAERPDLVLASSQLTGLPALELLTRVRDVSTTPFVVQVPVGEFAAAVSAIRHGADDVIPLPCNGYDLPDRIWAAIATNPGRRSQEGHLAFVGRSAASSRIREQIKALAGLRIPVLFFGEKGSGRDHAASCLARADGVDEKDVIRCSTGENDRRYRDDSSKTIYVNDIESHSRPDQAYWADRIIESERSAPGRPRRILVSTARNLEELSRRNEIDSKLANTLLRFVVHIPPLRERPEDVVPIAMNLSVRLSKRIGRPQVTITAPALRLLQQMSWPGNVSQLSGVVEKLVAFSPNGLVTRRIVSSVVAESPVSIVSLRQTAHRRQRDELVAILDSTCGNLAEAARQLGMSRGAVIYRAQKYGLLAKRIRGRA